jgi:sulfotransferase family protein
MDRLARFARRARSRLRAGGAVSVESRLAWILGSPRSGSTWLLGLLKAGPGVVAIDEPAIGFHLAPPVSSVVGLRPERVAPEQFRLNDLRADSGDYFFARRHAAVWQPLLRDLILGRLEAQIADETRGRATNPICVLKEPHGTIGADILMATLPASRMILLLRDGRDVVDSELAAATSGSWAMSALEGYAPADDDRLGYVRDRAHAWLARTLVAERAFEAHAESLRMRIRYEDLLEDPEGILGSLSEWLGLGLAPDRIREAVRETDFDALDPSVRGPGRFARAARPGLWRESLSAEEQAVLTEILGPKLTELGYA